jgi:hypothetical protein
MNGQIGMSQEAKLILEIIKQLDRVIKIVKTASA